MHALDLPASAGLQAKPPKYAAAVWFLSAAAGPKSVFAWFRSEKRYFPPD